MVDTSLASFEGELVATMEQPQLSTLEEVPFRVLLIGDWSGRVNRRVSASSRELKTSRPLLVDRDNLDQLMARLGVRLNIALTRDGGQSLAVRFNQLDDFHPDSLVKRLEIFDVLRRARAELQDPKTFFAAAATVRKWEETAPADQTPGSTLVPAREEAYGDDSFRGNLLDHILATTEGSSSENPYQSTAAEAAVDISELAKAAADPYLTPNIERDQDVMIRAVDARISALMNSILHHKDFQSLESAWRALDFLVSRLETGANLKLYLLDLSFDEFKADLKSNSEVRSTALYKVLVEDTVRTAGGIPWSVVAGNYTFDFSAGDGEVVESIASIAKAAGAPFIAGAAPHLLGCESLAATPDPDDWQMPVDRKTEDWWMKISHLASASYVGFALPRFLLRLPYGRTTDPTEEFDFEEFGADGEESPHESYLWANPAFAVCFLLASGFNEYGTEFRPSDRLEIEGLPMHVYKLDGDTKIKPCAEVLLTLRAAEKIIDRGLMPLLSMKDSDTIRLGMFQSIAGSKLGGRWLP